MATKTLHFATGSDTNLQSFTEDGVSFTKINAGGNLVVYAASGKIGAEAAVNQVMFDYRASFTYASAEAQSVSISITAPGDGQVTKQVRLYFTDGTDSYSCYVDEFTSVLVLQRSGSDVDSVSYTFLSSQVMELRHTGESVQVYMDGVLKIDYTDEEPLTGLTVAGLQSYSFFGTAALLDELTFSDTVSIPAVPTGLDHDPVTSTTIPLIWDAMAGADGYLVKIAEDSGFTVNVVTIDTATAMTTALALEPDKLYYFKVASYNDAGTSAYCSAITATTLAEALVAPTLSLVSKTDTTITVSFTEAEGGTAPYGYVLQVGTASEFFDVAIIDPVSVGSNVITGLDPSSTYYIRCIVTDADDFQETSNELVVTTRAISSGRLQIGGGAGVSFGRGLNIGSGAGVQF
jgi:hypothetical protein